MSTKDPYEVLGVPRGASQEEITKAYHELVKKYHPDKYQGNPLADLAKEKLQEVNEAYEALTKGGSSYGGSSSGNTYGSYGNYSSSSVYYNQVRSAINRNDIAEAQQLLVNAPDRSAEWYFLSGVLSLRRGQISDGIQNLKQACDMDPSNQEYKNAYAQVQNLGGFYRTSSDAQGYGGQPNPADMLACSMLPLCFCC